MKTSMSLISMRRAIRGIPFVTAVFLGGLTLPTHAADTPNQTGVALPPGDGWQPLTAETSPAPRNAALTSGIVNPDKVPPASLAPGEIVLPIAPPMKLAKPMAGTASLIEQPVSTSAVVPVVVSTPAPGSAPPALAPAPVISAAATGMPPFVLHQGDHIQEVLGKWLKVQGWRLDWTAGSGTPGRLRDLVSDEDYNLTPVSVDDLLRTLLAGYGYAADVDASPLIHRIVVRNDTNVSE